jgi:hypothetical protein
LDIGLHRPPSKTDAGGGGKEVNWPTSEAPSCLGGGKAAI